MSFIFFFFFFKQKTAYEMRISDWSSDVCSSDLPAPPYSRHRRTGDVHGANAAHRLRRRRADGPRHGEEPAGEGLSGGGAGKPQPRPGRGPEGAGGSGGGLAAGARGDRGCGDPLPAELDGGRGDQKSKILTSRHS